MEPGGDRRAYDRWRHDPASVDEQWRAFFEGFELAGRSPVQVDTSAQLAIYRIVDAYRDLGHLLAHQDPLTDCRAVASTPGTQ